MRIVSFADDYSTKVWFGFGSPGGVMSSLVTMVWGRRLTFNTHGRWKRKRTRTSGIVAQGPTLALTRSIEKRWEWVTLVEGELINSCIHYGSVVQAIIAIHFAVSSLKVSDLRLIDTPPCEDSASRTR